LNEKIRELVFFFPMAAGGLRHKDHGQHAKHEGLNNTDEEFEQ
jgi:hypothetical protein